MLMSPRFSKAAGAQRGSGARLIEAFSPKLDRRVRLHSRNAFDLFLLLESDPKIRTFCEYPLRVDIDGESRLIDFWVNDGEAERFLVIGETLAANTRAPEHPDLQLRSISLAELAAHRIWLRNWERMLPYITACRAVASPALQRSILNFLAPPKQLSLIERQFSVGDVTVVRAALFSLLHAGQVRSQALRTEELTTLSVFDLVQTST